MLVSQIVAKSQVEAKTVTQQSWPQGFGIFAYHTLSELTQDHYISGLQR